MQFTNPTICHNPVCSNRRRFLLDVDNSIFIDFQKVRVQETQAELPRGCIPRSLEIILRAEAVETVQAGDRYFIKNDYNSIYFFKILLNITYIF